MEKYGQVLQEVKQMDFSDAEINRIEKLINISRRSRLKIKKPSELERYNEMDVLIFFTGAQAMLESEMVLGEEGSIVYMDEGGQMVEHFVDGRIELI